MDTKGCKDIHVKKYVENIEGAQFHTAIMAV